MSKEIKKTVRISSCITESAAKLAQLLKVSENDIYKIAIYEFLRRNEIL